jgi:hypothetical protein
MAKPQRRGWSHPPYRVSVSFRAPLEFVFGWCTDYGPEDAALEHEAYQRKVIERKPRRVVFEDLEETKDGWFWSRDVVTLRPPNRWHMDGVGNRRDVVADYRLSTLPDGRTQLDLSWSRRPKTPERRGPSRAEREASGLQSWRHFAEALEKDYRKSRSGSPRRTK